MLFNSQVFLLLFLPVTLAGYLALWARAGQKPALAWVVLASLFFYGYWNPAYVFILIASVLCNFGLGRYLSGAPADALQNGGQGAEEEDDNQVLDSALLCQWFLAQITAIFFSNGGLRPRTPP